MRLAVSAIIVRDEQILLVEFDDPGVGLHYNLPGGGVEPNEALHAAMRREMREECAVDVAVGPLLLWWECLPGQTPYWTPRHHLRLYFECTLLPNNEPRLPAQPDPYQTAVRWVPLAELPTLRLLPDIAAIILETLQSPSRGARWAGLF